MNTTLCADVIVVGAGPAGSTAAALLARRGWDVLLLDRAEFPRDKTCGDGLTPRAIAGLARLGVLPRLLTDGYQVIHGARLHAPGGASWHMRFAEHNFGLPDFGLVAPRVELDEKLRQHAVDQGARFEGGVYVTRPVCENGQLVGVAGTANQRRITARAPLTIIATGANIGLLRGLGLLARMPAGVNAIRGYFTDVPGLDDAFDFYFDRTLLPGYAWVFPVGDGKANIGLGVPSRRNAGGGRVNLRRLLEEFMTREQRLRKARLLGSLHGYPIRTDFPQSPASGPGFLLVGEALGLVNPVTGEGIDLAIETGELAAETGHRALVRGAVRSRELAAYASALKSRYGGFFRGVRLLLRLATGPRALDILIQKAGEKPYLANAIAGINLGMISPWVAFSPRTWWNILS